MRSAPATIRPTPVFSIFATGWVFASWTRPTTNGRLRNRPDAQGCHLFFDEWHVRDTTDFIRRDRNHPCVVIWSAGNEIPEQVPVSGTAVLKELADIFHREDPTRPVTCACDRV